MLKLIHAFDMPFKNVLDYNESFHESNKRKELNCAILLVAAGPERYFDYIQNYEKNLYYLVDEENPNYIIGEGSIEDSKILNYHKEYLNTGNIGYSVRPNERNKGYGSKLLSFLLLECEKIGMNEVCVSCLKENIASKKVILNNNGKLEKEFFDDDSGKYGLKYWIKLHPKIIARTKRLIKRIYEDY